MPSNSIPKDMLEAFKDAYHRASGRGLSYSDALATGLSAALKTKAQPEWYEYEGELYHKDCPDLNDHIREHGIALYLAKEPQFRIAYELWHEKTEWVQEALNTGELPVKYLGWHRADILRDLIENPPLKPVALVKDNNHCPDGLSDELSEYLPVGMQLYALNHDSR